MIRKVITQMVSLREVQRVLPRYMRAQLGQRVSGSV
jgi:hypothetical protein